MFLEKEKNTSCLDFNFLPTSITVAMFAKLKGCVLSRRCNENIVEVKPLPYENNTTLLPPYKFQRQSNLWEIKRFVLKTDCKHMMRFRILTSVLCLLWMRDAKAAYKDAVYMFPTCFGIKVVGCTFASYRGLATCWDTCGSIMLRNNHQKIVTILILSIVILIRVLNRPFQDPGLNNFHH